MRSDFVIKCFMHDLKPIIDNIPTLGLFVLLKFLSIHLQFGNLAASLQNYKNYFTIRIATALWK